MSLSLYSIMAIWETGLANLWHKEDFDVPGVDNKCFAKKCANNDENKKPAPIKLISYTGAFFMLGIGYGVATFCFLVELIVAKYKRETATSPNPDDRTTSP